MPTKLPPGSYSGSCTSVTWDSTSGVLTATCTGTNGRSGIEPVRLDYHQCECGSDVGNFDGELVCDQFRKDVADAGGFAWTSYHWCESHS
jgi:hypothetical protein